MIGAATLLIFVALTFYSCTSSINRVAVPSSVPTVPGQIVAPTPEEVAAAREAARVEAERVRFERAREWSYRNTTDPMVAGVVRSASLQSINEFELDFPYQGTQRGTLLLRKHPSLGTDALIFIHEGQILCRIGGCEMQVRFDDRPARQWAMLGPESNDTTLLFVNEAERFITELRRSQRLLVELVLFQQPPVLLEFDVRDFDHTRWSRGETAVEQHSSTSNN